MRYLHADYVRRAATSAAHSLMAPIVLRRARRAASGRVPAVLERSMAIMGQLADALVALHSAGVVHRDVKPDNVVLVNLGGNSDFVKLCDFGVAKVADAGDDGMPLHRTSQGAILGTPEYMSPEQASGQPVDHRSDIYSFGVMLYELATGTRPFVGDSNLGVLSSILRDTPAPLADTNPALPLDLQPIVSRCLAKDRQRRYQSAGDLRRDLEALEQSLRSEHLGVPAIPAPHVRVEVRAPGRYRMNVEHASEGRRVREVFVVHARR